MVKNYQARLCKILLVVTTYNLLMQQYLSIRAKPLSDIIVDIFGNIINLSGKNYIVFGTHKLPYRKKGVAPSPPP